MVRRAGCSQQAVREGLSKVLVLGGLEDREEKTSEELGKLHGMILGGGLFSHQWMLVAHHLYDFRVFFTSSICFQGGMNITSWPPANSFLSATHTGTILSRDSRACFLE